MANAPLIREAAITRCLVLLRARTLAGDRAAGPDWEQAVAHYVCLDQAVREAEAALTEAERIEVGRRFGVWFAHYLGGRA
ncbi:MAG: hypothetical protein OWV35_11065 [Firmicutes bacterium]|nr:hypothetical protein [Bacillota bacterium]